MLNLASEWVSVVLNANSAIIQLHVYHGGNKLIGNVLDQHAELGFYSASSLKQQTAPGRHVAPLRHIILIPSQPVSLFLLNTACWAEKQQITIS